MNGIKRSKKNARDSFFLFSWIARLLFFLQENYARPSSLRPYPGQQAGREEGALTLTEVKQVGTIKRGVSFKVDVIEVQRQEASKRIRVGKNNKDDDA